MDHESSNSSLGGPIKPTPVQYVFKSHNGQPNVGVNLTQSAASHPTGPGNIPPSHSSNTANSMMHYSQGNKREILPFLLPILIVNFNCRNHTDIAFVKSFANDAQVGFISEQPPRLGRQKACRRRRSSHGRGTRSHRRPAVQIGPHARSVRTCSLATPQESL